MAASPKQAGSVNGHDGGHNCDVAEAGTVVHGNPATADQQSNDRADTTGKQGNANIKLGQNSNKNGGWEHGQHLLEAEAQHCANGEEYLAEGNQMLYLLIFPSY